MFRAGAVVNGWKLTGKVDRLGADTQRHEVVATANEDGRSNRYTIRPSRRHRRAVTHYTYSPGARFRCLRGRVKGGGADAGVDVRWAARSGGTSTTRPTRCTQVPLPRGWRCR